MKLLIFSPYYPPHIGGLESHAEEFNKYLSQKGVNITVFTPLLPENSPESEISNYVKIIRFPAFEIIHNYPLPKFWILNFWRLFFSLFRENYNFVISRTRFFNTSLLALLFSKIKKISWIHIEHGSDYVKLQSRLNSAIAKAYDHTFGWLIFKLCDELIANSKASGNFCKMISGRKAKIIYRGVEIEKIKKIEPNFYLKNKYRNHVIITFIGRLIDGKGVCDLLRAVENLSGNFKVFIVGDGSQKASLEKFSNNLVISDKIVFFGHKSREETISILKVSDIFVNPSYTEGLPSSVIEAALCKKSIIATNVGGTHEVVTNKSAFLIEPKNINLLREKLEILIKNKPLREEFGKNAQIEVGNKFNWDNSIKKYLDILKTC